MGPLEHVSHVDGLSMSVNGLHYAFWKLTLKAPGPDGSADTRW